MELTSQQSKIWLLHLRSQLHLSVNVLREVCSYIGRSRFLSVWRKAYRLYDLDSHQSESRNMTVDLTIGGGCVEVDGDVWLCIGAYPPSSSVYAIDVPSRQVTPLPGMITPRASMGLGKTGAYVYVFGGVNRGELRSCEKFRVATQTWEAVGDMQQPRWGFMPCLYRGLMYLISINTSAQRKVESFDLTSEIFSELSVTLPPAFPLGGYSVSFQADGKLYCLSTLRKLVCWNIKQADQFQVVDVKRECWSAQPALVLNSEVLLACKGLVVKFSLQSYRFQL